MNFHIEHHMYAGVPCYRLGRLHKAIKHDLPACPVGLVATWREISGILKRQKAEPNYQYRPKLPQVTSAEEVEGFLYLGNLDRDGIRRLRLPSY